MSDQQPPGEDGDEAAPVVGERVRRRAVLGALSLSVRGAGIRIFGLVGYFVSARFLAPNELGLAALGLTVTFAAHFVSDAGLGLALIRSPASPERADYAAVSGVQLAALATAVAGCTIWALLGRSEAAVITTLFVASLPVVSLRLPASIALERELRYGPTVKADLTEVLVYNVWIVGGLILGGGVYALATGAIVKSAVGTVVLNRLGTTGWVRPRWDPSRVTKYLRFGFTFQLGNAASLARDQAVNILTAAIVGYGVLGLWAIAARVLSIPALVFESLMRISFPASVRLLALGEDLAPVMENQTRRLAMVAGLVLAPSVVGASVLVPIFLGSKWDEATDVVPLTCIGVILSQPVSVVATGYLLARDDPNAVLRVAVIDAAVQVAVTAALLPILGFVALGIGAACAALADGAMLDRAVRSHCTARLLTQICPGSLSFAAAVAAGLCVGAAGLGTVGGIVSVPLSVVVFALTSALVDRDGSLELVMTFRALPARLRRRGDEESEPTPSPTC